VTLPVDPQLYLAYLCVMFVFVVTPGPAILFALATGVRQGPRGVVLATAGMNLANVAWYLGALLGLSALAATFPAAFAVLRWAGIAYLFWLGLRNLWAARHAREPHGSAIRSTGRPFRDGLMVQLSNPKALLFITAVLPPFIAPDRALWPQIVLFAAASIAFDVLAMLAYGLSGAALAERLTRPRARQVFAAVAGLLFLVAALLILIRH
jgi:threonine/homoserine/homoserine lactone efflux protein